jgi:N-acetylglutamate synthase-like GNAT family acetyltransferase
MSRNQTIRTATDQDLRFVLHLQRKFSNEVGFVPSAGIERYIDWRCVQMATENGEPAGYVLCRPPSAREPHLAKIIQTAVSFDARRQAHGLALIDRACRTAVVAGATIVQACVRRDLDANAFFLAAGFTAVVVRSAPTARAEDHIIWRRPLLPVAARLFTEIPRPYRSQGPGGRFLPTTAVADHFRFRRPSRAELRALHAA